MLIKKIENNFTALHGVSIEFKQLYRLLTSWIIKFEDIHILKTIISLNRY